MTTELTPKERHLLVDLERMDPSEFADFLRKARPFDPEVNVGRVLEELQHGDSRPSVAIAVPFEGTQPLEIDPVAKGIPFDILFEDLDFLSGTANDERIQEELERIFRATVILLKAGAGNVQECFHTAVVWERG